MDIRQTVTARYTQRARRPHYPYITQCRFLASEADVLGRGIIMLLVSALRTERFEVVLLGSGEAMPALQRKVLDVVLAGVSAELAHAVFGRRSYVRVAAQRLEKVAGAVPGWAQGYPFIIALRGPAASCFWEQWRLEAHVIERAHEYQGFDPGTQIAPWIPACRRRPTITPLVSDELVKWQKRKDLILEQVELLP